MAPLSFWAQHNNPISIKKDTVFAFFEYKIKDGIGMKDAFDSGYGRDLEWHRSQDDDWSWIGWYVSNGERRDRFIDATPDHQWSDFDQWKVNGALNSKLNKVHWLPYVENPEGSYGIVLSKYSNSKKDWFKSNSLQVHHIKVSIPKEKMFLEFLTSYKTYLESYLNDTAFIWMKTVSGGGTQDYQLLVCIDKIAQMEKVSNIFNVEELPEKVWKLYAETVVSNVSEMWRYMPSMSLYPNE